MRRHHRRIGRRAEDERGWAAEPRFTGSPPREGVASNGKRPRSRSRGRFQFLGGSAPNAGCYPASLLGDGLGSRALLGAATDLFVRPDEDVRHDRADDGDARGDEQRTLEAAHERLGRRHVADL